MIRCWKTRSGVPVLVHWSVPAIALFLLGVQVRHVIPAAIAIASYLGVLLLHEWGHQLVAERRHCRVHAIQIYPIHGLCCFETPWSAYDHALIAWGGVAAQVVIAAPIAIGLELFGYTPFSFLNIVLAIFGFWSPAIALFNLLPIAPLDGKIAWSILPIAWSRVRPARRKAVDATPMQALEDALKNARRHS